MTFFSQKTAIVTGAGSGIGEAVCKALARQKALVVVADINAQNAARVAQEIVADGHCAKHFTADVSKLDDVKALIEFSLAQFKEIDYFFNNAGISIDGEIRDMEYSHWEKILNVNLWGTIYGTNEVYKQMLKQKKGHIVNMSSLAGLMPGWMQAGYATTKWGILGLTTSLRAEAEEFGIKVSAICPGMVETNIFSNTTLLNIERDEFISNLAFKPYELEKAVNKILRGVRKNKAMVIFPFHAKFLHWLFRFLPSLMFRIGSSDAKKFRKMRVAS